MNINITKTLNTASDVTTGALMAAFGAYAYFTKDKYFPKDKKRKKKLKKQIAKNGLEIEISPLKLLFPLHIVYLIRKDLKTGDKYTIFSSAIFTTIILNLFVFKKD